MNSSNPNNQSNPNPFTFSMLLRFIPYFLFIILFMILYKETFFRLFKSWFSYENSHGLLILGISIYFIWRKRKILKFLNPVPLLPAGTVLLIFSCFILIAGKLSHTYIIQDSSLIFSLLAIVLILGGIAFFKSLFMPIGYLIFMLPVFSELLGNFSIYLQQTTALIAAHLLKVWGMPVLRTAQFIELPHISLEVAQACNGVNHIMALVALSIPLAILSKNSLQKKLFLVLIAFAIGIMANGLRVALIGIWSAYKKSGPLHGPHDIFYVSFIFFFGMILLFIINRWFESRSTSSPLSINSSSSLRKVESHPANYISCPLKREEPHQAKYILSTSGRGKSEGEFNISNNAEGKSEKLLFPILICLIPLLFTTVFIYLYKPIPVFLQKPLSSLSLSIGEWKGHEIPQKEGFISKIKANEELNRTYKANNGREIKLFIRYFSFQEKGKSITDYRFHFPNQQWETVKIKIGHDSLIVNKLKIPNNPKNENIYFWYEISGKTIHHHYWAKLELLINALFNRHSNGAIVFVISPGDKVSYQEEIEFIHIIISAIKKVIIT